MYQQKTKTSAQKVKEWTVDIHSNYSLLLLMSCVLLYLIRYMYMRLEFAMIRFHTGPSCHKKIDIFVIKNYRHFRAMELYGLPCQLNDKHNYHSSFQTEAFSNPPPPQSYVIKYRLTSYMLMYKVKRNLDFRKIREIYMYNIFSILPVSLI